MSFVWFNRCFVIQRQLDLKISTLPEPVNGLFRYDTSPKWENINHNRPKPIRRIQFEMLQTLQNLTKHEYRDAESVIEMVES